MVAVELPCLRQADGSRLEAIRNIRNVIHVEERHQHGRMTTNKAHLFLITDKDSLKQFSDDASKTAFNLPFCQACLSAHCNSVTVRQR